MWSRRPRTSQSHLTLHRTNRQTAESVGSATRLLSHWRRYGQRRKHASPTFVGSSGRRWRFVAGRESLSASHPSPTVGCARALPSGCCDRRGRLGHHPKQFRRALLVHPRLPALPPGSCGAWPCQRHLLCNGLAGVPTDSTQRGAELVGRGNGVRRSFKLL